MGGLLVDYHYGITIREARERLGWTQSQLAEEWGVSTNYVSEIERGKKEIRDLATLRKLCELLQIPLWKVGLTEYDPFNPCNELAGSGQYGIVKLTDSPDDRISDYKNCLLEATGHCFISGTSMIHLSEDSGYLLKEKVANGTVSLLLLDPDWIATNSAILTFLDEEDRSSFHYEIRNSIRKLKEVRRSLSPHLVSRFRIKTYSTIFPHIITGFDAGTTGKIVVEVTDYVPDKFRPRFTVSNQDNSIFFDQVKRKFDSLWNNDSITKEI
jgi:transcriptional regulator with XRE-family HTH domain